MCMYLLNLSHVSCLIKRREILVLLTELLKFSIEEVLKKY